MRSLRRLTLFAMATLTACSGDGEEVGDATEEPSAPLLVMAAASLNTAMPELIAQFEANTGIPADLVLGATGNLAAQIENGAPADLFFSADAATVERLRNSGAIRPESVVNYANGELVLVWREGIEPPQSLADLADPRFEAVAIANPEHAPYGAAAREALQGLRIWDEMEPRVVMAENVSQSYQLVGTGNADAGLVSRSVLPNPSAIEFLPVDPALHTPIRQAAGVLVRSTHPGAQRFLDFVTSVTGQTVLQEAGFRAAGG